MKTSLKRKTLLKNLLFKEKEVKIFIKGSMNKRGRILTRNKKHMVKDQTCISVTIWDNLSIITENLNEELKK